MVGRLVGSLSFMAYQIHYYTNSQFYFKQFRLAGVSNLILKKIPIQDILFGETILIQTIQFRISMDFNLTHLNIKTILFQTIQFSVSTISMSKQFYSKRFS